MRDWAGLTRLADAVADGIAVDWNQLPDGSSPEDRAVVEQLRVLATISTVHRTTEPRDMLDVEFPAAKPAVQADRQWGPLLILGELGAGSQGRVYRALDPRLQREVALKVVRHTGDAASAMHLVAEARLLARVRHPNIVTVYGADRIADEVGLWMELVEGRTLASRVATDGPYSADEAALIGATLCRALAAVHQAGLLHRDIKAQNVMREAGGRVVLMDFGAGRDLQEASQGRRTIGTPVYLAPEVLAGEPASVQSDIYSLGVLLLFLTTKRFPVIGTNLGELRERHQRGQIALLRDLRPDLPEPFVAVVARALAPDPRQRFESAGRLEEALTRITNTSTAPAVVPHTTSAPVDRRRRRLLFAAAVATALAGITGAVVWRSSAVDSPTSVRRIAVLPLQNLGAADQQYVADGVTDLLIAKLSELSSLQVISRTSAMQYRDTQKALPEIARELRADAIVEGSVLRSGSRVRVSARLIHAGEDTPLWADTLERDLSELLSLEIDLARGIASRIQGALTPTAQKRLAASSQVNAKAQDEYLRGWAALQQLTTEAVRNAASHFETAVQIDPGYARAWAVLSHAYWFLASTAANRGDRDELYQRTRAAATRAIDLDALMSRAHAALAQTMFYVDHDWAGAEAAFRRAIELDPSDADAHEKLGWYLGARARFSEALSHMRFARELDPLTLHRRSPLAAVLYYARRYDEAAAELTELMAAKPGWLPAQIGFARVQAARGLVTDALRELETLGPASALPVQAERARVHAVAGQVLQAREVLNVVLTRRQAGEHIAPDTLAFVYVALGDHPTAFALLEEAYSERSPGLVWLNVDPRFDAVRKDPTFVALLRRVGFGG